MPRSSGELAPAGLWQGFAARIAEAYHGGAPFEEIHEMNIAIKQRDLQPYAEHRARLDECLWPDDPDPKRIVDFGAGYGAMASFWPAGSTVTNVDLPIMLEIQQEWVKRVNREYLVTGFVPFNQADTVELFRTYFFAAWSLTETTLETWEYYIERAELMAGAYVLGFKAWEDKPWPWDRLAAAFKTVRRYEEYDGHSMLLCAVNR